MDSVNPMDGSLQGAALTGDVSSGRRGSGGGGNVRGDSTRRTPALPAPQQVTSPWPGCRGYGGSDFRPHQGSSPQNPWGYPQGGFVNFLQQPYPPSQGQNFHFTGLINQNFNGTSPEASSKGSPSPEEPPKKKSRSKKKTTPIEVDDDDGGDPSKAKKRWTHDEEVILASAWLNNSNDPIRGGDKKGETFWKEITEEYNSQVPENRKRGSNQLQIRWTRLKTSINDFNGFWSTVCKLHTSGYSNEQLMDEAQKMYAKKHGRTFHLVHWWTTLKNEPKWCAYVERLEKEKNKNVTIDVEDDRDQPRPIGREAAKAQLRGKGKKEQILDGIVILGDNINKMVQMQNERKVEREKVSETQLEISKTNLKAAKEQKMSKMYEVYHTLINQDTSKMSEKDKASRERTIQKMELKLFTDDDEADV